MRSSHSVRTSSRRRAIAARLAGLGAAGVVAAMVAAPLAAADESPAPADATSADSGTSTDPATSASTDPGTPSSDAPSSDAPSSDTPGSTAPSGSGSAAGGGSSSSSSAGGQQSHAAKPQVKADLAPNFGSQKIRVGIQKDDGSWFPADASLAGSTVQAVETGPNAPGTSQVCITDTDGTCEFDTPSGMYFAAPGDTVTFTQLTRPTGPGIEKNPTPQVVGPCVLPEIIITAAADDVLADFPTCGLLSVIPDATAKAHPQVVTNDIFGAIVTIIDPAIPPTAVDDATTAQSGVPTGIGVLNNDITFGAPTTISNLTDPAHGVVSVIGNHVDYQSTPGWGGVDTFDYTITTPNGSSTATVTVTVIAPPDAVDDTAKTFESTAVTIPVLANDSANGGANFGISAATTPGHGKISFAGDSIVYTPADGFTGTDTFTYTVTTDNGSDTALVTITVAASGLGDLANTGADPNSLGSFAALLMLGGGGVLFAGRKRRVRRAH